MARFLRRKNREIFRIFLPKLRTLTSLASSPERSDLHRWMQKCARERRILDGKISHGTSIKIHHHEDVLLTSNILINMYSKCGLLEEARQVFDEMPVKTIVSWNSLIAGIINHGSPEEALQIFSVLHREGTPPSEYTLSILLSHCSSISRQLHCLALKIAMAETVYVATALIDAYQKIGAVRSAFQIFDRMAERSSVTWSSMVAGLARNRLCEESLKMFIMAQRSGSEYSEFTFSAALSASASVASSPATWQLHALLEKTGVMINLFVITALVDAYSRCGKIRAAYRIFNGSDRSGVAIWNAMIAGFAKHGRAEESLILLQKMRQSGVVPDEVSYSCALSAMARGGLVEEARWLFSEVVCPNQLHYSCLVDALARSGRMKQAWELIHAMPFPPTAAAWGSLLGSCKIHRHLGLAKHAAKQLFEIEPENAGNHVILSNIFAASRRWDDVAEARKIMKNSGARKEPGVSWIEIQSQIHTFVAGHRSHPWIDRIHDKLAEMEADLRKLRDVEDEDEEMSKFHSEKLALAFGLLRISPEKEIVIFKNLRVCRHCHSFMKLASAVQGREIVLRDTNRFHHFSRGSCSCNGFW
ncbi:pentatricopeptide repeat (PPR) superfamily protein [Wolffia australiana]